MKKLQGDENIFACRLFLRRLLTFSFSPVPYRNDMGRQRTVTVMDDERRRYRLDVNVKSSYDAADMCT